MYHTKGMTDHARKRSLLLGSILFEVTWAFGKMCCVESFSKAQMSSWNITWYIVRYQISVVRLHKKCSKLKGGGR